jgi:hypothetical protein
LTIGSYEGKIIFLFGPNLAVIREILYIGMSVHLFEVGETKNNIFLCPIIMSYLNWLKQFSSESTYKQKSKVLRVLSEHFHHLLDWFEK